MCVHEPLGKHKLEPVELPKGRTSCKTYTRRGRALTSEEKKSTLRAAEIFKSNNPFFKVVLRPSYVYKSLLLVKPMNHVLNTNIPIPFIQFFFACAAYSKHLCKNISEWY